MAQAAKPTQSKPQSSDSKNTQFGLSNNDSNNLFKTDYKFEVPNFENSIKDRSNELTTDKAYGEALKYNQFAARDAANTSRNAMQASSAANLEAYQGKSAIDNANKNRDVDAQLRLERERRNSDGGGFSSYEDGSKRYDPVVTGSVFAPKVEYRQRESPWLAQMRESAGFAERAASQNNQRQLQQADRDRYNQSMLSSQGYSQQTALADKQNKSARELAQIEASARLGAAGLQAQGNILSSLFGSVGSGSPNYRYWN